MKRRVFTAVVTFGAFAMPALAEAAPPANMQETPSLAAQVKSGALPPVAKRIPQQPSVVTRFAGSDGPGRSGGEVNMLVGGPRDTRLMTIYSNARLIVYDDQF
jgi:peptide/nickel transport system substrate-binding protein